MRALTIGSAMVDIIVLVDSRDIERITMHNATSSFLLLEEGGKIEAESISTHIGGGAVNAAVAMARLGLDVRPLIKLGRDVNGDRVLDRLTAEGVDTGAVLRTGELETGTAVMVSSHERNAAIFTRRGTNTLLRPDDVEPAVFAGRELVYVTSLSNRSADRFPAVVEHARGAGAFVAANPGIRQLTSRSSALLDCLARIDLLAINRQEAEALVPMLAGHLGEDSDPRAARVAVDEADAPRLLRVGLAFGGFDMSLSAYLTTLLGVGVGAVLVSDGADGAYLATTDGIHYCPPLRVEVQGTAGAGDALIATCATYLAEGAEPGHALRCATHNAAAVVSQVDTQSGLADRATLEKRTGPGMVEPRHSHWPWSG